MKLKLVVEYLLTGELDKVNPISLEELDKVESTKEERLELECDSMYTNRLVFPLGESQYNWNGLHLPQLAQEFTYKSLSTTTTCI